MATKRIWKTDEFVAPNYAQLYNLCNLMYLLILAAKCQAIP